MFSRISKAPSPCCVAPGRCNTLTFVTKHPADAASLRHRRRSIAPVPPVLLIPPVLIAVSMAIPLFYLVLRTAEADISILLELVVRRRTAVLLGNTLALTGYVLVLSTAMAVPLAWLVVRTNVPGQRVITLDRKSVV